MAYTTLQLWLLAIRPRTLPAAVGPVVVGAAVAFRDATFSLPPALGCLFGALLLQIGVNLANDYFDHKNNIDSGQRLGPVRVSQSGLIAPSAVKNGMIVALAFATAVFLYLSFVGGLPVVVIGFFSVLAALAYSGGPYPLASHGLGELFVFIFFGPVAVVGTYFVLAGRVTWMAVAAAVPPGLLISAIMVVNNLRDIENDRDAGKKSLAVIIGRNNSILEYRLLVAFAYLIPAVIFFGGGAGLPILLPLASLFFAWSLYKKIGYLTDGALNGLLASTAVLSFVFSLLFAMGLIAGG